jgi:glycosyltransferase involved in cell wall biosynthesis
MPYLDPKISVVIPITNMSGRLENLEASIKRANPKSFQLIIVHDRRDDATWFELEDLTSKYDQGHILLIDGVFGSAASARNEGVGNAIHDLLAFWDADDVANPEGLLGIAKATDWSLYSAVATSFSIVNNAGRETFYRFTEDLKRNAYLTAAYPGIWRWLFKKIDLQYPYEAFSMGEDQLYLARNLRELKIKFATEVTYQYFSGVANQATAEITTTKMKDLIAVSESFKTLAKEKSHPYIEIVEMMRTGISLTLFKNGNLQVKLNNLLIVIPRVGIAFKILKARRPSGNQV